MRHSDRLKVIKTAFILFEEGHDVKNIQHAVPMLYPKLAEGPVKSVAVNAIEMHRSLVYAVDNAGGSGWPWEELCTMSVMDLISTLCTNGIRFHHEDKGKKEGTGKRRSYRN